MSTDRQFAVSGGWALRASTPGMPETAQNQPGVAGQPQNSAAAGRLRRRPNDGVHRRPQSLRRAGL